MFSRVRKFKPVPKPRMEPVEWRTEDTDRFNSSRPTKQESPGHIKEHRAQTSTGEVDFSAVERPQHAHQVRFGIKEGVRQVYISSLDELRRRLDLDEKRSAGLSEDDLKRGRQKEQAPQQIGNVNISSPIDEDDRLAGGDDDTTMPVDDDDLEVDQEKLDRNRYAGILKHQDPGRERMIAREDAPDTQVIRSPVLRRQEVREAFGSDISALNQIIFDSACAVWVKAASRRHCPLLPMPSLRRPVRACAIYR
ncbi:hypothetical protein [Sinorhizobium medicae]|uniref:hypothetical protein n=1 Tax=Sinorhizobium medicae TaxID=110321 RepID=UPI000FD6F64F|nr:hypothetical protein [Sinorhizobium medicae]RVJ77294.1 hypothetical protein CN168_19950 [Sinorhizobium medicae]